MRAVRAVDGSAYDIDVASISTASSSSYDAIRAQLSEISGIPSGDMISMHPNGRQTDEHSAARILSGRYDPELEPVFLFDRQLIELDPAGHDIADYLNETDYVLDQVLNEVRDDPTAQKDVSLELVQSIRSQHSAIQAALLNLNRHTGGKQETINAYSLYASPLMSNYRDLLAAYNANVALADRVKVSPKMRSDKMASSSGKEKDRMLGEYINKDKMREVRDQCKRTMDELTRKNTELEQVLKQLREGTDQLQAEHAAVHLEDVDECERDAIEVCDRIITLRSLANPQDDGKELAELGEEVVKQLEFLVHRRNAGVRSVLHSLHSVRGLQSLLTESGDLAAALDRDLRTKTDAFKHLQRLQSLVPSYVATLAESIRRRLFASHLKSSSSNLAEYMGKLTTEEKKRRGRYQVEHARKLPWEVPGLEESVPNVEIDVRSSKELQRGNAVVTPPLMGQEATLEDLEELHTLLSSIEASLTPEDMPMNNLPHPVTEALSLLAKQKKQIINLREEFERLDSKLEDSTADPSAVTSVNMSNTESGDEKLRALEERNQELERESQAERAAREEEIRHLQAANAELEKERQFSLQEKEEQAARYEQLARELEKAKFASKGAEDTLSRLKREHQASLSNQAIEAKKQAEARERALRQAQTERDDMSEELQSLRQELDQLAERNEQTQQALSDKERLLRDAKSEAELDHATLEKALSEEKERSSSHANELEAKLRALQASLETANSDRDGEFAELQVMCNERGRALEDYKLEKATTQASIRTLLNLFRLFFDAYTTHLKAFIDDAIPIVTTSSSSPSKESSSLSSPAAYQIPVFSAASLESAVTSLKGFDSSLIELARKKMDLCALQTKKWMKECKRYKERATRAVDASKEKLAFRSFTKSDLALFLPTRNSTMQVFAAFNLGRPNYFLKPTGDIAEQVKTREWIVARITDLAEGIVDGDDPSTNPYALAAGSKYFMLEAEPYTVKSRGERAKSPPGKGRPVDLAQRRASTSEVPVKAVSAAATQTEESQVAAANGATDEGTAEESFSILEDAVQATPQRPMPARSASTPLARPSNLTAARPANLEPVEEVSTPISPPSVPLPATDDALLPVPAASAGSLTASSPPFIRIGSPSSNSRRAVSSATRPFSTSIPKSLGSSNGSASSSLHHRMSSSFLARNGSASKGSATTATTPQHEQQYNDTRSWAATPLRHTQTVGRYTGRKDRRHASASVSTGSTTPSAADLLRSFTVDM